MSKLPLTNHGLFKRTVHSSTGENGLRSKNSCTHCAQALIWSTQVEKLSLENGNVANSSLARHWKRKNCLARVSGVGNEQEKAVLIRRFLKHRLDLLKSKYSFERVLLHE